MDDPEYAEKYSGICLDNLTRSRPEDNERRLLLTLTEAGEALREQALSVPEAMRGCIDLPPEELLQLKHLLDKALSRMGRTRPCSMITH